MELSDGPGRLYADPIMQELMRGEADISSIVYDVKGE